MEQLHRQNERLAEENETKKQNGQGTNDDGQRETRGKANKNLGKLEGRLKCW